MKIIFEAFLFTISYFTLIPIKKNLDIKKETYFYTLFFFPLIGFILGSISIIVFLLLSNIFHPLYSAFISAVLYICLYGFLHLEAICDVVDANMAKYSKKDIYAILKDPHIGAIGAIYTFVFILVKLACITYILYENKFELFLIALIFSRLNLIYALKYFTFHKNSFLSLAFKQEANTYLVALSLIYLFIALYLNMSAILLFLVAFFCFFMILKILQKKFSFLNGDCIGFTIEHTELVLLNLALVV